MTVKSLVFILLSFSLWGVPALADMGKAIVKVKPAVVIVGTYKATNSPRFNLRGTGFVMAHDTTGISNLVITNAHVLPETAKEDVDAALVVQLRLGSGADLQMRAVTVLSVDRVHDLALLRMSGPAVAGLNVRDSAEVKEGQSVAFMGFPIGGALGFSPVTHRGMISSIAAAALPTATANQLNAQVIRSLRNKTFDIFQLDGTAYPGNSGGPLFDPQDGDVLGVVNMVFIKGTRESALTNPSGISYAIPSRHVLELVQSYRGN